MVELLFRCCLGKNGKNRKFLKVGTAEKRGNTAENRGNAAEKSVHQNPPKITELFNIVQPRVDTFTY